MINYLIGSFIKNSVSFIEWYTELEFACSARHYFFIFFRLFHSHLPTLPLDCKQLDGQGLLLNKDNVFKKEMTSNL